VSSPQHGLDCSRTNGFRFRVYRRLRISWAWVFDTKLAWLRPCVRSSARDIASVTPVLERGRFFTGVAPMQIHHHLSGFRRPRSCFIATHCNLECSPSHPMNRLRPYAMGSSRARGLPRGSGRPPEETATLAHEDRELDLSSTSNGQAMLGKVRWLAEASEIAGLRNSRPSISVTLPSLAKARRLISSPIFRAFCARQRLAPLEAYRNRGSVADRLALGLAALEREGVGPRRD
jgi:hypothetical protein